MLLTAQKSLVQHLEVLGVVVCCAVLYFFDSLDWFSCQKVFISSLSTYGDDVFVSLCDVFCIVLCFEYCGEQCVTSSFDRTLDTGDGRERERVK